MSDTAIVVPAIDRETDVSGGAAESMCPPLPDTKNSYGEILKSSTLIGGSQAINIGIGICRTKAMAMLLGPAGFGLAGLYNSLVDLTQTIAGVGVNSSGVRQIAEAVGSMNEQRIAMTATVLRRTSVVLGLFGALGLIVFSRQISFATFNSTVYTAGVMAISVAAFCKLVSGGQGALIQGTRRIADLAKMNVFGALFGAIAGVVLVYIFREKGVVGYVIAVAASSMMLSWWYSRKIKIPKQTLTISECGRELASLLRIGVAFMISSLVTLGVAYVVKVLILKKVGIAGTGLYQSAWTLGGLYVGFILQAMGADFYPRLTSIIHDHVACNRLVNEQARVGLLLAGPGVLGTLTFAPLVMATLYSAKFAGSVPILRWICLGAALQVISWPMGFIIVAKGKQNLFIFSEVAWATASLGLAWLCVVHWGLLGAGISFFLSYVFHAFLTYGIVSRLSGFRWSKDNVQTGLFFMGLIAAVFMAVKVLPVWQSAAIGIAVAVASSVYSARVLCTIVLIDELPGPFRGIARIFRIIPAGAPFLK